MSRKPRRAPTRPHASPQNDFSHNNYLAEMTPNWGHNRKGAGAPRGNRNADLGGLTRNYIQLLRLRARNKMNAERLPLLAAKIAALEACLAARQGEGVR
jgi:hypothetical protein